MTRQDLRQDPCQDRQDPRQERQDPRHERQDPRQDRQERRPSAWDRRYAPACCLGPVLVRYLPCLDCVV